MRAAHLFRLAAVAALAAACSRSPAPSTAHIETPVPSPSSKPTATPPPRVPPENKPFDLAKWPLNPPIRYAGRMYSTLQKAVDVAKAGDRIELPQGIYDQTLKLANKKGLTLAGLGGGAFISVSTAVPAAVTVSGSSGITFEHIFFRRAEVAKTGRALIEVIDSAGVSFFHCFLDGAVVRPPDGDGLVVRGGTSILLSNSFLRWADTAMILDHVIGQAGIDRSVVSESARGVSVRSPGARFELHVSKSRVANTAANLSIGNAPLTMKDSLVLHTTGPGDTTPAKLPPTNKLAGTVKEMAKLPDPPGVDWSWEPAYRLLNTDVGAMHKP